ncbi:GNAT family N-acetyltransferase [Pseudoalteromonas rubra]|uniref:tRNA(Met) cytidine acetyltransferase TmcA n=1 Tax=Pseudoalteromonas rubra TaxID=43658 RepID=A0A5S3WYH4_9GAMM|nr:GNAT family N-acetyltransferase [Pseudoalteromonas rubra]TMP36245.1 tRNA(Met) cytidine acetyltransferase [Pseudoalteromonas rubra]
MSAANGWSLPMPDCNHFKLARLLTQLAQARHRQLLLISGEQDWTYNEVQRLFPTLADSALVLSQHTQLPGACWPEHLHQVLGQEYSCVVYDLYSGVLPNKLAAAAGTVQAGGLLILLAPELSQWHSWCDPALARWLSYNETAQFSPYLQRWQRLLTSNSVWQISQSQGDLLPQHYDAPRATLDTSEQHNALTQLTAHLTQPAPGPVLLSADRGRGKSSLLGKLAASLPDLTFILCAQQRRAVHNSFVHLGAALDEPVSDKLNQLANLRFMPPDQLLAQRPSCDVLLVDEAAAIPVPMLMSLLGAYPNVVFSSTLIGYEGNGRGYTLRFARQLEHTHPQRLTLSLSQPIRYSEGDPLEARLRQLFALDCDYQHPPSPSAPCTFESCSGTQLAVDEDTLSQVFALLVLAHYQTSVNDLRQLLDSPHNRLYLARQQGCVVAVCLLKLEGEFDIELSHKIAAATRRPAGHLMAQQLAQLTGNPELAQRRGARVVRIAVSPQQQGQLIGSQLLRFAEQQLTNQVDYFGSSFGCNAQLLRFWQHHQYRPVKLGFKQDKASGEFALLVIKPLNKHIQLEPLQLWFKHLLLNQLSELYRDFPCTLVTELYKTLPHYTPDTLLLTQLSYFSSSTPGEQQIAALITELLKCRPDLLDRLSASSQALVIRLLLQRHPPKVLEDTLNLATKKQRQTAMRSLVTEVHAEINLNPELLHRPAGQP